jgi:hypothetical protein
MEANVRTGASYKYQVTWLPEEKAKVGKWLELKSKSTGEWEDGWLVVAVWGKKPVSELDASERDYTRQRKHSDV